MPNTNHPINGLLDTSMQNLRSLVDANTVVGEAINTPDGTKTSISTRNGKLICCKSTNRKIQPIGL